MAGSISAFVNLLALADEILLGSKLDVFKKNGSDEVLAYLDLRILNTWMRDVVFSIEDPTTKEGKGV